MQLLYAKDIIYIPKDVENEIFPSRSHFFISESNSFLLLPFILARIPMSPSSGMQYVYIINIFN